MFAQKRWSFGLGTIFSLIVVYFIFLYSRDKKWTLLAFISKWYLIIVGGLIVLSLGIVLLIILFSLFDRKYKSKKTKEYIDVEYKVKE